MQRFGLLLALILLPLLGVSRYRTAFAGDNEIADDVRCIYVGVQASQSADPARQWSAVAAAMYYLGRLDAIAPQSDLLALLLKESASMSKASVFQSEASRCGLALTEKGKMIQQVGTELLLRGREKPEKEASPLP